MKYLDLIKKLQKENEGYIVLIKNGIFFIGVGKDAVILNDLLGLKVTCMKEGICKVGFQTKSIEKYIKKLEEINKSFVIFVYDKELEKEEQIYKYTGESVKTTMENIGCKNCIKREESEEEIIERIKNLGANKKL